MVTQLRTLLLMLASQVVVMATYIKFPVRDTTDRPTEFEDGLYSYIDIKVDGQ